jgi:hypothetical protein
VYYTHELLPKKSFLINFFGIQKTKPLKRGIVKNAVKGKEIFEDILKTI